MSNEIANVEDDFGDLATMDDLASLAGACGAIADEIPRGKQFLKFDKNSGNFVYGEQDLLLSSDVEIAVNIQSFQVGYIGWAKGEIVGELMRAINNPKPVTEADCTPSIPPSENGMDGWNRQFKMQMKTLEGLELSFGVTSKGGIQAISTVADQVGQIIQGVVKREEKLETAKIVPIVKCISGNWYKHKTWGKTFVPKIEVVRWVTMSELTSSAPVATAGDNEEKDDLI
jgi:hypothetical protein